jgi:hypothetical protein
MVADGAPSRMVAVRNSTRAVETIPSSNLTRSEAQFPREYSDKHAMIAEKISGSALLSGAHRFIR